MEADGRWQSFFDLIGKVDDHIFAGGLVIYKYYVMASVFQFVSEFNMRRVFVEHGGVVENIYDLFFHDLFEVTEVDNHTEFHITGVSDRRTNNRYGKFVAVAVHVFAFAIIAVKGMACFETELLGNPYPAHRTCIKAANLLNNIHIAG